VIITIYVVQQLMIEPSIRIMVISQAFCSFSLYPFLIFDERVTPTKTSFWKIPTADQCFTA